MKTVIEALLSQIKDKGNALPACFEFEFQRSSATVLIIAKKDRVSFVSTVIQLHDVKGVDDVELERELRSILQSIQGNDPFSSPNPATDGTPLANQAGV